MKSIKNQYIALKEGKLSEAQFMRNVRMTLPEYISNVTLFKQAERILLNKGIINEIRSEDDYGIYLSTEPIYTNLNIGRLKSVLHSLEKELGEDLEDYIVLKNSTNKTIPANELGWDLSNISPFDNIESLKNRIKSIESLDEESNEIETVQDEKGNFTKRVKISDKDKKTVKKVQALMAKEKSLKEDQDKKYQISKAGSKSNPHYVLEKPDGSKQIDMMFDTPEDAKKYAAKKELSIINEAKDTSATGYYNQDGKEQYGKFNELDNMNAQEIMAGYVMEKQDNPDIDKKEAVKLVIKNLKKDQFYYTNYKLTGVRDLQPTEFTTTKRKPFFDEMEEVNKNGDNFVDEKNKMQVVKESKKNKMKTQINEVKRMRQLAGLITESQLIKEDKLEDIKSLLSDETLRNSDIGYSSGDEVSITYKNSKKLPFEDFSKLEDEYIIYKDELSDEPYRVQYFIGDKSTKTPSKPKPSYDDEDVFENYNNKQNTIKPDTKNKLKEMVRKMMKEMFDGRDNLTDIE
jgi:hypothetical protein